ncbi:hypothetical protein FCM35_KLT18228 [Carex littledalei]|uniref:Uncharacterized protein n=1 Tax=Carex littledalei TaxID=544730 RepID=A0A833RKS6_9POAL|nr:hypothetical protein FCM35_KLT18228 [Carex littledalei]
MVTAPEEVWAPLLKDKEIKRWYNKPFPYFDDLHKVYCVPPPIQPVISTLDPIPRNLRTIKKRSAISKFHDDYLACKREEAKLISDAIKEKSVRIAARDKKFSITVAMDAFQELEGFDMADFIFASNLFIADARVCEAFMACKGKRRAEWIKAMIEQHKAKQ